MQPNAFDFKHLSILDMLHRIESRLIYLIEAKGYIKNSEDAGMQSRFLDKLRSIEVKRK